MTVGLMLDHIGANEAADAVERASYAALKNGARTADIAAPGDTVLSTSEMATAIMDSI